jgi:hypothetical protein
VRHFFAPGRIWAGVFRQTDGYTTQKGIGSHQASGFLTADFYQATSSALSNLARYQHERLAPANVTDRQGGKKPYFGTGSEETFRRLERELCEARSMILMLKPEDCGGSYRVLILASSAKNAADGYTSRACASRRSARESVACSTSTCAQGVNPREASSSN